MIKTALSASLSPHVSTLPHEKVLCFCNRTKIDSIYTTKSKNRLYLYLVALARIQHFIFWQKGKVFQSIFDKKTRM